MSKRTLTPLAPCPVNLHPVSLLSSWRRGGVGTGSGCLLRAFRHCLTWSFSAQAKGNAAVLLGCVRAEAERLLPCLSELPCSGSSASACPTGITHPPLVPLARTPGYFGYPLSFEPAVLVLLTLTSSQPSSTSEDQKAVPGPRADLEWCCTSQTCWGVGSAGTQLDSMSQ